MVRFRKIFHSFLIYFCFYISSLDTTLNSKQFKSQRSNAKLNFKCVTPFIVGTFDMYAGFMQSRVVGIVAILFQYIRSRQAQLFMGHLKNTIRFKTLNEFPML